jgi:hypothetical protein
MENSKIDKVIELLIEIRDLLKNQSPQPQTKITVVGNRSANSAGRPPKTAGLNTNEDFTL